MLSQRLKSLVKYIDQDDSLIDIGADHALLAIYLIKNNILPKTIISDINKNALTSGIKNIQAYELEDEIETRLGNGLEIIDEKIDTVLISGMGSKTIIDILNTPNIKYLNKIITQSNNDYDELRSEIAKKGFYITDEEVVKDRNRYYINIVFEKGHKTYTEKQLKYGPFLIGNNQEYFKYLLDKEIKIFKQIPKDKKELLLKQEKEIENLKNLIKGA